ncbi:MAG: RNA polymerase sigma factor [Lachnospiraceae bacterium]|nr:RNA polymerase sigma factor [Lachnospiraceae bacterium]
MTNESDEELYDQFLASRDENIFRVLVERHKTSLLLFLNGFVHNLDDAEELMVDTFAETVAGPTLFSGRSSFKTWLFSIGKHLALMHLRKNKRHSFDEDAIAEEVADPAQTPELQVLEDEKKRQLYMAMKQLNSDYREILLLLYFEDMSHEEAARVMGKNKRQTYHLAERGRAALKETLERMGFSYA